LAGATGLWAASDVVLFDFEGRNPLKGWTQDGEAFEVASASAPYYGRIPIKGVQDEQFLYSFDMLVRSNNPVGALTSPEFTIQRDHINFILGGNRGWPERLGVQLVVDSKVVRSSTGRESRPAVSFNMLQLNWDVKEFKGKRAKIVFNDHTPYGTLAADHFVMSDTPQGWRSDATVRFQETYRPAFHASVGRGRTGDANGMVYYKGKWFLGYQLHYTDGGGTGWGYSVSDDLVHWTVRGEMVPVGLTGMAFSGGAFVDHLNTSGLKKGSEDPILLCYTLLPPGAGSAYPDTPFSKVPKADDLRFYPAFAYSQDGGDTWVKDTEPLFAYSDSKLLTYDKRNQYTLDGGKTWVKDPSLLLGDGGFKNDRDGKVFWHEPTKNWIMIWHLSQNNDRPKTAFGLYRSKDFKKWELFQTIPGMWECPDMFEMDVVDKNGKKTGKKYWIVSRGGVEYFIGTFDGNEFVPMTANNPNDAYKFVRFSDNRYHQPDCLRRVTWKGGYYAAQTFANAPDGRHIQVSWLNDGKVLDHSPGSPFECLLSFPVELTLRDTGEGLVLEHMPVKEIEKIYSQKHEIKNLVLKEGVTENPLPLKSALLDIDVTFDAANAKEFGLEVLGEKIVYKVKDQRLFAFRAYDDKKDEWRDSSTLAPLKNGKISLRILVDRSSIEISINNGVYRTTALIYPQTDEVKLNFISEGGRAKIEKLVVNEIECEQASANTPDKYREQ